MKKLILIVLILIPSYAFAVNKIDPSTPKIVDQTFEKVDDTTFKSVSTQTIEKPYNLTDLKNDRAIYVQQIEEYQTKIDTVDALIAKATELGVAEAS